MSHSNRSLLVGAFALVSALLSSSSAHASEAFPGAIQEAANMPCVPTCLLCHTSNPGTASTWQGKPGRLALNLKSAGAMQGDGESLKRAFATFAASAATDPAVAAALAALQRGEDPASPGTSVCGAIYGCGGARVAKTPPSDRGAIAFAVAAVAVASLLRRRRNAASRP